MNYSLLNKDEAGDLTHGTYLTGRLPYVTYNDLVNLFGEPTYTPEDSGDGKVNFEWVFKSDNGEVFTIYDWKEEVDYTKFLLGKKGERMFHVGGKSYSGDFEIYIEQKVAKK